MKSFIDRIKREPVLLSGFVSALLLLAVTFGVSISDTQVNSIVQVIGTLGLLLGAAGVARAQVVPAKSVIAYVNADGVAVTDDTVEAH